MVREQLMPAGRGINDERVIEAMRQVPRHLFVPPQLQAAAYDDRPLPIGGGQTISQPYVVALMTQLLKIQPTHRVLEIGTGCGYQAAVLAHMAAEVFSVEVRAELSREAAVVLKRCAPQVQLRVGDGWQGWKQHAPYDRIMVTCAPETIPPDLVDQLAEGGRMLLPVGPEHGIQQLQLIHKHDGVIETQSLDAVRFVPMVAEQ